MPELKGKSFFQSKKVRAFLIGIAGLFLTQFLGLHPDEVEILMKGILTLTGGYLGGEVTVDIARAIKQPPIINNPKTD